MGSWTLDSDLRESPPIVARRIEAVRDGEVARGDLLWP